MSEVLPDTTEAWRLVKAIHAAAAFEGEGAFRFGGRWNSPGTRVVYASSSLALAALEFLVHIDPAAPVPELTAFRISIPADDIETATLRPSAEGTDFPPLPVTRAAGDSWAAEKRSAVLRVASAVVPTESNVLIDPAHPRFGALKIRAAQPFRFDPRLVRARR